MRSRLVRAFVLLVVAVVVLYGAPRAYILAEDVESRNEDRVGRRAEIAAAVVTEARSEDRTVSPSVWQAMLGEGERLELVPPTGAPTVLPAGSVIGDDDTVAVRELPDGSVLTYSVSGETVAMQTARAVLPLLLLGLGLIPLGMFAGSVLARRLARPFAALAETARAMGRGRLDVEVPRYGVPEADEIAAALRESAAQLAAMLERERDVAVHASHELRTPITALRLALEDITLWPEASPEIRAEMGRLVLEVDRIAEAVTTLLDSRRRWSHPVDDG